MKKIVKIIDSISLLGSHLSAFFIIASILLIISEILARVLFNRTIYITDEYSGYLMCAISFTAIAFTLKEKSHIRMSFLLDVLKGKNKLFLDLICNTIGFIFSSLLLLYTFNYFWDAVLTGTRSMTISETYIAIPKFFMPFGSALLTLQFFSEILKNIMLLGTLDKKGES